MDRKGLEILARDLEMAPELAMLSNSDDTAHIRFGNAVKNALDGYSNLRACPRIVRDGRYASINNFSEAILNFEDYYGLNEERKTQKQIGEETTRLDKRWPKEKRLFKYTRGAINNRIKFVRELLKQKNREDIKNSIS